MSVEELAPVDRDAVLRDRAVKRLKKRRDFYAHLLVYTMFNATIVVIWAMAGADGFFWPIFLILFWGIGLVMNAWDVFRPEEFTEAQIRREVERLRTH